MSVPGPHSSWQSFLAILIALTLFTLPEIGCAGGTKSSGGSTTGGSTGGGGNNNPTGQQFLYIAEGGNSTSAYTLGSDGSLTAISGSPFSVGGASLAADSNGKFLFSLGGTSPSTETVNTDTVNSSGALAVTSSLSDATFAGPVQINPNGNTLYVDSVSASQDNPGIKVYSIQSNGSLQFSTAVINQNAGRFTFLSDGSYAYAAYCYHLAADIQGFNTASGGLTVVSNNVPNPGNPFGECPNTVALTPSGTMLAAAWSDADNVGPIDNLITLYTVDPSSHALTPVSTPSFPASGAGVDSVFDSSGKFFIVAQDNGIGVYQVSQTSVTEVAGSPFANGTNFTRVALSPAGGFVVAISSQSQQVFVFSLNSSTGALTLASGSPQSVTTPADLAIAQ